MASLDISIAAGSDDGQETAGTMAITGTAIANDLDATTDYAAMRYIVPSIGSGATITVAYLTVRVTGASNDEPDVLIWANDVDNAATLTTAANNISGRTPTTATVNWSSADLGAGSGTDHNTSSLVTIIQEIVDRPGWSAGNGLMLIMQGSANAARDLNFRFFEHADGAAGAPRLHIEYTNPVGGTTVPSRLTLLGVRW
jgi:hypothetical protein